MTKDEILNLSPEQLAVETAVRVMGWEFITEREDVAVRKQTNDYPDAKGVIVKYGNHYTARTGGRRFTWNPAEDISAAWEVAEKFESFQVTKISMTERYRVIIRRNKNVVYAETAPEAICKAALLASMEVQRDETEA